MTAGSSPSYGILYFCTNFAIFKLIIHYMIIEFVRVTPLLLKLVDV
jgi:hypothetical protein